MFKLYVDMDGVLTDFNKQLLDKLNFEIDKNSKTLPQEVWKKINSIGKSFWSSMDWTHDGKKLWNHIKKYNPIILTSPSNHPSSIEGKKEWIENNIPDAPYILESEKEKYAKENHILIDDRPDNIKKWENNNGIGILHTNYVSTIEKLQNILSNIEENKKLKESYSSLINIYKKLSSLNKTTEATTILKIAENIKEISEKKFFPPKKPKKFLWFSGDERLEIIKEVLDNIIRKRVPSNIPYNKIQELDNILKKIKQMSITEYENSNQIETDKKEILSKIFDIDPNIAELVSLLFKPTENIKDLNYITNLIRKKAQPYLAPKRKEFKEEDYYVSPIFKEMLKRRANLINISYLPKKIAKLLSNNKYL